MRHLSIVVVLPAVDLGLHIPMLKKQTGVHGRSHYAMYCTCCALYYVKDQLFGSESAVAVELEGN